MPADCFVKVVSRKSHEILDQKTQSLPQATPKVILPSAWQAQQRSMERPVATPVTLEPRVHGRFPGVPPEETQEECEESWDIFLQALCKQLWEESSNNQHTPFSEQSKEMNHSSGNVEGFELCQLSERIQCPHRVGFSTRGISHCDCGTCLIPSEQVRQLYKEQFDVLTVPFFTIEQGTYRGYRCGRSDERKSYHQAKVAS